jgi:hypothetical protein
MLSHPWRKMASVTDLETTPACIIDGCDEPRYHDADRCHRHNREHLMTLPPGIAPLHPTTRTDRDT